MLIQGNSHTDKRGRIQFFNDFDMSPIKRIYTIYPEKDFLRAWQGHKIEAKWFYCVSGSVCINLVKVNDWEQPDKSDVNEVFILKPTLSEILSVQSGYVTGIKALETGTILVVFSDLALEASKNDDFRFDSNYWIFKENMLISQ